MVIKPLAEFPQGARRVLSIDGGSPDVGAALYVDGMLTRAAWVKVRRPVDRLSPCCRFSPCRHNVEPVLVADLCDAIERAMGLQELPNGSAEMPQTVLVEVPVVFGPQSRGASPLLKISMVCGALFDRAAAWGAQAYGFKPAEWKGNLAKPAHQARMLTFYEERELALLPRTGDGDAWRYATDGLDGSALGLWWLQRIGVRATLARRSIDSVRSRVPVVRPRRALAGAA